MYVVESKGGAIACMLLALLFLGTWPAIMTLLERRGRLPQHTFLDYTITNLLAALIIAFTLGEIGKSTIEKPNFIDQLTQVRITGLVCYLQWLVELSSALENLATQYAWPFVGLSVTEVIDASITVVIGTTLNYFLDGKINRAEILFPGVGCFLIAVCFASAVHSSNAADNKAKLASISDDCKDRAVIKDASEFKETYANKDLENGTTKKEKAEFGTANFLIELENKRAIKVFGKGTFIGLAITFFAGVCFSLFSPAFNLATNDKWHTLKDGVPHLSVYTAFFYFSVSCFVIAIILNINFLYRPVLDSPKSSFKAYLSDWNGRGWALLAGLLCGFGNGLQFMGGQAAGYAAADAVQALPLVSTFGVYFCLESTEDRQEEHIYFLSACYRCLLLQLAYSWRRPVTVSDFSFFEELKPHLSDGNTEAGSSLLQRNLKQRGKSSGFLNWLRTQKRKV
ncbi:UNVERIFIED_CONTAM: Ureide permease 1 [Sesamum angustifolium]|uniref:Ureide permease 1 n=1 Tax=Sesamum angustifolium TaxID=2727405 RepID=A0AAW2Q8A0_9LAMI